ncbi:uncharacterized protein NEMAJ01_0822 [Nematocida major]|uniref:uncharacterized protein n=1 Tax=Nematocida major TaxID=1912982 RepID=UPI002007A37C|nr:uncharacterized protein NEMAJ01_0822 [Nematocida major]KAH9385926.1 hypothetical protein NEMAJ01_0822 [Nematocida major]
MLGSGPNKLLTLKIPNTVSGDVEIRSFKSKGVEGTVLLTENKTFRIVCREDSNTFLVKDVDTSALSMIEMCLECAELKYGEKEIMEVLPEVCIPTVNNAKMYISKEKLLSMYPMTDAEYKEIFVRNRVLRVLSSGTEYFSKTSKTCAVEVLLLLRSLSLSKETECVQQIESAFNEILSPVLFQLAHPYVREGAIDIKSVRRDVIGLIREISKTPEEFSRNIDVNCLGE